MYFYLKILLLRDFSDITNHEQFSITLFYNLLRRTKAFSDLAKNFKIRAEAYPEIITNSCLYGVSELFSCSNESHYISSNNPVIYFAAPHKNISKNRLISKKLSEKGINVNIPYELVARRLGHNCEGDSSSIRKICMQAINESQFLVVDLDTYGMDTAWEIGYAEGLGKRVLGYNEDMFMVNQTRNINRRRYDQNFMHGWDVQQVFSDFISLAEACKDKIIYVCGPFKNKEVESVFNNALKESVKELIFPKNYIDNQKQLPRDYPLSERGETNRLLEEADILLVVLPRYGMDSSWQIGFATAHNKTIYGIMLQDDEKEVSSQSFWDHWMHAWVNKIRVTGLDDLISVLHGLASN